MSSKMSFLQEIQAVQTLNGRLLKVICSPLFGSHHTRPATPTLEPSTPAIPATQEIRGAESESAPPLEFSQGSTNISNESPACGLLSLLYRHAVDRTPPEKRLPRRCDNLVNCEVAHSLTAIWEEISPANGSYSLNLLSVACIPRGC